MAAIMTYSPTSVMFVDVSLCLQDSEAAGDQTYAEFKRQRRAEQDDVEFPDEVT